MEVESRTGWVGRVEHNEAKREHMPLVLLMQLRCMHMPGAARTAHFLERCMPAPSRQHAAS